MKKWTQEEINEAVRLHGLWIAGDEKGKRANFVGASLNGANLNGASLNGANFVGASLNGANLNGASLNGANLNGASLDDANFVGASLNGANLNGASLDDANLNGASLYGASLNGANLNQTRGIKRCSVDWDLHGESGRKLTAVRIGKEDRYFCGCFAGSLPELREFIAKGDGKYEASRAKVADFVADCMAVGDGR